MKFETLVDGIGGTFGELGKGYTGVQAVLDLLEFARILQICSPAGCAAHARGDLPDPRRGEGAAAERPAEVGPGDAAPKARPAIR